MSVQRAFWFVCASVALLSISLAAACGGDGKVDVNVDDYASPTGYWEGEGHSAETPLKDEARDLTRSVDYTFWFSLAGDGTASGEITLTYDALLTVVDLPSISVPVPALGSVSFDPEVGGKLTDKDPTRIFPLVGVYDNGALTLEMVAGEEPDPLEFTLQADPGVSAGLTGGGLGVSSGIDTGGLVYVIDMRPFSPFGIAADAEKRPGGPYAAHYEEQGDSFSIEWTATQQSSDVQSVTITPEMQSVLDSLLD
jgi:hypothetical protein